MDELKRLVDAGHWGLEPPVTVRGITITASSFDDPTRDIVGTPAVRSSAHDPDEVALSLRVPYLSGPPVALVQHALVREGLLADADVDGVFGPFTAVLVKQFQARHSLTADGVVGPSTWAVVREVTSQA